MSSGGMSRNEADETLLDIPLEQALLSAD